MFELIDYLGLYFISIIVVSFIYFPIKIWYNWKYTSDVGVQFCIDVYILVFASLGLTLIMGKILA